MKKILYVLLIMILLSPNYIYAEELEQVTSEQTTVVEEEKNLTEAVENKNQENTNIQIVTLQECTDGDTARFLTSDNEIIKARFLAVDTPETVHPTKGVEPFGKEASEYTCTTLTNAKEIKLEYDQNSKEEDNYGRKLVWVFTDGVLLQESLVSKGYAEVTYLYADYKYTSLLQDTEVVAKSNKVGIWSIEEEKEETKKRKETKEEEKDFFESLVDSLLGAVLNFINELLESILKFIENML